MASSYDGARATVVIDVGFGDSAKPGIVEVGLPALLDQPAPPVRAHPYEIVIAEKYVHARLCQYTDEGFLRHLDIGAVL